MSQQSSEHWLAMADLRDLSYYSPFLFYYSPLRVVICYFDVFCLFVNKCSPPAAGRKGMLVHIIFFHHMLPIVSSRVVNRIFGLGSHRS